MENSKTIASRLGKYMSDNEITPYKLYQLSKVSQSTIGRILKEGKANRSTLTAICDALGVNVDWLETGTGDVGKNMVNEPSTVYEIEVKYLNGLNSSLKLVPLVNQYAYGGYLNGFADSEFIENLPKVPFILDKEYKGEYLCFEVKGDSMECDSEESIPEGSILLCRNVRQDYWKSKLHINKWDFVIVHKTDGILVKRISKHDTDNGSITIHSLNDFYEDREINLNDVQQIFNIIEVQLKRKRR